MKILSSNKFNEKIKQLNDDSKARISQLLDKLGSCDKEALISMGSSELSSGVYVLRVGDYRIFYTLDTDESGKQTVLILIDIITREPAYDALLSRTAILKSNNDPKRNHSLNPIWNLSVNPTWNQSINPTWNQSINPTWNQSINPTWNQSINPTWNHRPKSHMEPEHKSRLNPKINPNINPLFSPKVLYDLDGNRKEFLVSVTDHFIQLFTFDLNNTKFGVEHPKNGYVVFEVVHHEYIGHLESNGADGYNYFDTNSNWIGFVI